MRAENVVLLMIKEGYSGLSDYEKRVADFVLENADETLNLTVASLSRQVQVSEPTVIRFCRKLNFTGYQEFKIALAKGNVYAGDTLKVIHEEVTPEDSIQEISNKVINSHILAMQQTFSMINYEKLEQFVGMIQRAEHLDFFGLGGSGTVAVDEIGRASCRERVCLSV